MSQTLSKLILGGSFVAATIGGVGTGIAIPSIPKAALSGTIQVKERVLVRQQWRNEPYKVPDFRIKGTRIVKDREPFEEDGEWLRNLSFPIKNVSDKAITFIRITLAFPETRRNGKKTDCLRL